MIGELPPAEDDRFEENVDSGEIRIEDTVNQPLVGRYETAMLVGGRTIRLESTKTKEEVCPVLNADKVEYDDSEDFNNSKILVQDISIKALRIYLTFRIQQIENALGVQGIG